MLKPIRYLSLALIVFMPQSADAREQQYCRPMIKGLSFDSDKLLFRFIEHCKPGYIITIDRPDWAARLCDFTKPVVSVGPANTLVCTVSARARALRLPKDGEPIP